ncbi:cytochrome P450 [Pseudonocardia sp. RS11V-5]|uniref:cytochrome P450 n=1 Tax=Pseudonocardia terrae TaxID=2905831 RepID=UPI001E5B30D8|nr:cytochrome P450 [Pseudonocardia terrae]MCE3552377.1 cytochrome P450 [Pseudonocardia terrae]
MVSPEVAPFDPFAPTELDDNRRTLVHVRSRCPVAGIAPGLHFAARHETVRAALLDPSAYSNNGNFVLEAGDGPAPPELITQSDPPRHSALRALLRPGFTRAAITEAAPWIREYADALLDGLAAPTDLVGDYALPLTARVIARLVGVPAEDAAELARLSLDITAILPAAFTETEAWRRLEEYFSAAARERRAHPTDDLITLLATSNDLSDREVAFHAWQLFVAGLESTAYTIGSTLRQLLENRTLWEELCADRALLDGVREEGLRHGSAIRWVLRTVVGDHDLGGTAVHDGERVIVGLESANLDEVVFGPNAAAFDPRRPSARRHVSFGHGIHLCLGAELSRIEISTALEALADRMPGLRLAPGTGVTEVTSPMFCGPARLDVTW